MTTALAFAVFADAPVDVAVVEVGLGGAEDSTNVLHAGDLRDHPDRAGPHRVARRHARRHRLRQGRHHPPRRHRDHARRSRRRRRGALLERCADVGATVAREGSEFGVLRRAVAVGGQVLTLQGLGGVYDEVFLPLHGAHQAQNAAVALAAVEAFLGAGAGGKALDAEVVREGFAAVTSPGRLERVRSAPTILVDAAHNPHGMAATVTALTEEFGFRRLVAVVAVLEDKDAAGMLELLEPVRRRGGGDPQQLAAGDAGAAAGRARRARCSARTGCGSSRELPDAIEAAVTMAEDDPDGELSGVGVLITGSVFTVADARRLLSPGGNRADAPAPDSARGCATRRWRSRARPGRGRPRPTAPAGCCG